MNFIFINMVDEIIANYVLDVRGHSCPYPAIQTLKKLKEMKSGEVLKVIASDKGAKNDIPTVAKKQNSEILKLEEKEEEIVFYIKKL